MRSVAVIVDLAYTIRFGDFIYMLLTQSRNSCDLHCVSGSQDSYSSNKTSSFWIKGQILSNLRIMQVNIDFIIDQQKDKLYLASK